MILDASVLIGLLDDADAHHERAVDDVEAADEASTELVAPASAYSDALVAFARVDRIDDAREAIAAMGNGTSVRCSDSYRSRNPTNVDEVAELAGQKVNLDDRAALESDVRYRACVGDGQCLGGIDDVDRNARGI